MTDFATFRQTWGPEVNAILDQQLTKYTKNPAFTEMMRYALLNGGKRLRPLLTLAVVDSFDRPLTAQTVAAANAVEWIHSYSLVHDDLPALDNDDLRRGLPTVHAKFGEANAILVGDALLTGAFEIFGWLDEVPATTMVGLYRGLAAAAGANGMVIGQIADIAGQNAHYDAQTLLDRVHTDKTGALIRYAAAAGGVLAGETPSVIEALANFGHHFGLAFQIQDDLDDVQQGSDAALGTLPKLLGIDGARDLRDKHIAQATAELARILVEKPTFDAQLLIEILELARHD